VTQQKTCDTSGPMNEQASLSCLIDAPELLRVRVLPAEFARLLGVSKQCVSRWIRAGKVTPNPVDGRLDVQTAVQQVLRNTDPGRMRARVLRAAVADVQSLREAVATADQRVAAVEAELAAARLEIEREAALADNMANTLDRVLELLVESELALRATADSDEWRELIERIDRDATNAELDDLAADAADALDALTPRAIHETEGGGE
jgi:hypothetical protein